MVSSRMNEAEANKQLKALAAVHGKAKLDAQDYRRQRRLILAKFSASDCAAMDETIEWHEPKSSTDDTAELQVPGSIDDTAEIEIDSGGHRYKIWIFAAVSLLVVLVLLWRNF